MVVLQNIYLKVLEFWSFFTVKFYVFFVYISVYTFKMIEIVNHGQKL